MFSRVESEREREQKKGNGINQKRQKGNVYRLCSWLTAVQVLKGNLLLYAFIIKCRENIFYVEICIIALYILLNRYYKIFDTSFNI